ncbi:MAG: flagellar hook-length control protein FliK [Bacillota bacterium]
MRADFTAISPEAAFMVPARAGNANSGQAGEGINNFMTALLGAMTLQQNAVSLPGGDTGDNLPVLPVTPGEGSDSQGMLLDPDSSGLSTTLLSMLTLQMNQLQEVNGTETSSIAGTVNTPESGIQETYFRLQQPARTMAGGAENLTAQPLQIPKTGTAGEEKGAVSNGLKPPGYGMISETAPGGDIQKLNLEFTAKTGAVNTAGGQLDNTGGGLPGLSIAGAESETGEGRGLGGQNTGDHPGKEGQLLNGRQAPVKESGPPAAGGSQMAELPAGGSEVGERLGASGDKNPFGKDSLRINPEKTDGEAGIKGGAPGISGESEASAPDGRHIAADGGKNREQVQVNAGSINIQNVTPKKFPAEILPHVLSTVRNAGHESRVTVIRLKLVPENMGEISIRLSYVKGELTAHFFTNSGLVREAVESSFPQLKETLTQYNVELGEAAAFVGQEQQGRQGAGYAGSGHNDGGKMKFDFTPGNHGGLDSGEAALMGAGGNEMLVNILV